MKLTFIANACCIMEVNNFKVLTDPWLVNGAFDGSWCHYPPLKTTPEDVKNVDCLYISHLHPDHFDKETLPVFRRDIPIVILDQGNNYLMKMLQALGFTNLIPIKNGQSGKVGPFKFTLYAPFEKHVFHESSIGNLIDSAIVAEGGGFSVVNCNDNTPSVEAARMLRERHGHFSVAQINYNAAGPFPSCFDNMNDDQKLQAHHGVLERNLKHLVAVGKVFQPDYVMPFAGAFVVGGKQWRKNVCLGTTTWDAAADFIRKNAPELKPLVLNEGMTFDLAENRIINGPYTPVDVKAQSEYIEKVLSKIKYPYESDQAPVNMEQLKTDLIAARKNLWEYQRRFNFFDPLNFYWELPDEYFHFRFNTEEVSFVKKPANLQTPYLVSSTDMRLLRNIVNREMHWDNVQTGFHVDFNRNPDVYQPDVYLIMSFFHLPRESSKGSNGHTAKNVVQAQLK